MWVILAQITEIVEAGKGLESGDLKQLLMSALYLIGLGLLIPLVKTYVDYLLKIQADRLEFEEKQKEIDREFERSNKREQFEYKNKTIEALSQNSDTLNKALSMLSTVEYRCNSHSRLLHSTADDLDSLSENDLDRLKEAIDARET